MAYQLLIKLSEQEYADLEAEAAKTGKEPEAVLHDMIRQLSSSTQTTSTNRPLTSQEFLEKQYREGKILNIPTRRQLTPEEEAERERLGQLFAGGKPLSEMVIEDRGPY